MSGPGRVAVGTGWQANGARSCRPCLCSSISSGSSLAASGWPSAGWSPPRSWRSRSSACLGRGGVQHRLYTLLPFGRRAVSRRDYLGEEDLGTGPLGLLGNLIWLILAGWWLALGHLITAILLAVTIIGIPFAWAHLKLAGLALWPIGEMIVEADDMPLRYPQR